MSLGKSYLNLLPIKWINVSLALLGLLVTTFIVFSPYMPKHVDVSVGQNANKTISSPVLIEFQTQEDVLKTQDLQKKRASLVEDVYTIDEEINKEIQSNIISTFTEIKILREKPETPLSDLQTLSIFNKALLLDIKIFSDKTLSSLEYITIQLTEELLGYGVEEIKPAEQQTIIKQKTQLLNLEEKEHRLISTIIQAYLKPNKTFSEQETQAAIQHAIEGIKPFTTVYKEGQPIVYKGEMVTQSHIDALVSLNMYGSKPNITKFIGIFLFSYLSFLLLERFMYYFNTKLHTQTKYMILTTVVMIFVILIARIFQESSLLPLPFEFKYMIPISISAMVLSLLVTPNISLLCGTIISILITIMYKTDFTLFLYLFFSNCVASFASYRKNSRTELIVTGYIVGAFNMIIIACIGLLTEVTDILWYVSNPFLGLANGIVSSMISLAILPYLESIFTITTQQSLLELSNLNHPLLKRLMMTAPGTYQHSLMVANLSEAAAEAINVDPVLCRVGAYFHDIGKMKRPLFFIENQMSGENPHHALSPRISKLIIASHPKDGVDLAKKYKLPKVLQDFMMEHHGTTLVSFFYEQALNSEEIANKESTKDDFRYPGPKPTFKESGIVMFADSIEAAIRSMNKPSPAKVESLIDKIVNHKIEDGQMDDCPLSLKEIDIIKETFIKVFNGVHHGRIDYNKEIETLVEQNKEKGNPQ